MGFVQILTLIFITLKLTNYIDWSWWWVFSPISINFFFLILYYVFTTPTERALYAYRKSLRDK
jgi:hypothetical protein